MSMFGGWLGWRGKSSEQDIETIQEEFRQLHDVLQAGLFIVNDDIETAEATFRSEDSAFHKLGYGITSFLRAILGFEQDVMIDASKRLADAESTALQQKARAVKANRSMSDMYPPGTEYALCAAEAQIMSALVGVLNESVTEALKGFYKLRKAFITLDGICKVEQDFRQRNQGSLSSRISQETSSRVGSARPSRSLDSKIGEHEAEGRNHHVVGHDDVVDDDDDDDDDEFHDADDAKSQADVNESYKGKLSSSPGKTGLSKYNDGFVVDEFSNPVDGFIFSGSNLHFGVILVVVSLIPPSFNRVLSILGFRGDRVKGIERLWRATQFKDVAGAMAGLVYLIIGNIASFMDIIPREGPRSFAKDRCDALLDEMIQRFPRSTLWQVEEARSKSRDQRLEDAIMILNKEDRQNKPLPQVETLRVFEVALDSMYLQRFEDCAQAFLKCVELNNWSHGLYYHIAGSCYVELYRLYTHGGMAASKTLQPTDAPIEAHYTAIEPDAALAVKYADQAEECFRKIPSVVGKKKLWNRQLPFDVFVARKLSKWEARAKLWNVRLVDAVGVSPLVEMMLFWSGMVRMRPEQLESAMKLVDWSASSKNVTWHLEDFDERALHAILKATLLRNLNRFGEAKDHLTSDIIDCGHRWDEFKSGSRDNWTAPMARYEMAACIWKDWENKHRDIARLDAKDMPKQIPDRDQLVHCSRYLEEVKKWGDYDLQTRMGIKITTGRDTMTRFGITPD